MGTTALLALITALVPVANDLIGFIFKAQETLKQDAELTPEQEAALDEEVAKLKTDPQEWQKEQEL